MRLELTRVGLLVELANHYTTRGATVARHDDMMFYLSTYVLDGDIVSKFKLESIVFTFGVILFGKI